MLGVPVQAADNGHGLYWRDGNNELQKVEGEKFVAVGRIVDNNSGAIYPCAQTVDGLIWTPPTWSAGSFRAPELNSSLTGTCDDPQSRDYSVPAHSATWASKLAWDGAGASIDERGQLWVKAGGSYLPTMSDVKFVAGASVAADGLKNDYLLGDPRVNQSGTTIAQIPQTGDPAASPGQWMPLFIGIGCLAMAAYMTRKGHEDRLVS